MSATAVSGKLYSGAITSSTGVSGTLVSNVEAREYRLRNEQRMSTFRTGLAPDQKEVIFLGIAPTVFLIRPRDIVDDLINLIFAEISNAGGVAGDGTGVTGVYEVATKIALIVRPNDAAKKTLYIPNAQIAPGVILDLLYSEKQLHIAGDEVAFIASRSAGNTEPSFSYDTAANVNDLYAALS